MRLKYITVVLAAICCASANAFLALDYQPNYKSTDFEKHGGVHYVYTVNGDKNEDNCQWVFDSEGRLAAKFTDGIYVGWGAEEYFNWDGDRLISSSQRSHGSDVSFYSRETTYEYDDKGRIVKQVSVNQYLIDIDNHQPMGTATTTYTYGDNGKVVKTVVEFAGKEWSYSEEKVVDVEPVITVVDFVYDGDRLAKAHYKGEYVEITENILYDDYKYDNRVKAVERDIVHSDGSVDSLTIAVYPITNDGEVIAYSFSEGAMIFDGEFNMSPADKADSDMSWANYGDGEKLKDFMHRFTSDDKFCRERSAGMVVSEQPVNVPQLLMLYGKNADKSCQLDSASYLGYFGPSEGVVSFYYKKMVNSYYTKWLLVDQDMAVLYAQSPDFENIQSWLYVFARIDDKWRLIGTTPA